MREKPPTVPYPSLFQGHNAAFCQKIEKLFVRLNDPIYLFEHAAAFFVQIVLHINHRDCFAIVSLIRGLVFLFGFKTFFVLNGKRNLRANQRYNTHSHSSSYTNGTH